MYRVWFQDLEKALQVFCKRFPEKALFVSIDGNMFGDFLFHIDKDETYTIKHKDLSIWKSPKDWRDEWTMVAPPYDEDEEDVNACMRESLGDGWW